MSRGLPWALLAALLVSACGNLPDKPASRNSSRPASPNDGRYALSDDAPPAADEIPANVAETPDPVPVKDEPLTRSGNPDSYAIYGKTYFPKKQREIGYSERGKASWYAKKFHGHKTASGEIYDMFAMTGAHKTLPLPTYVRVTRRDNGKSCVVRINDRGPFHPGRVVDLSYAAAARLDMIRRGEAEVEIEVIDGVEPDETGQLVAKTAPPAWRPGYWVAASFEDPIDAAALREDLRGLGLAAEIQNLIDSGSAALRVIAGPYADEPAARNAHELLLGLGLSPQWRH